jgi:hypothetical protein
MLRNNRPVDNSFVSFTDYTAAARKKTLLATGFYQRELLIKINPSTGQNTESLGM